MPGPYPLPTLAATIDASGITAPPFEDILASLQAAYWQIYGSDVDLAPDTQDGQWIAVQAQAIFDMNMALINGYLSYSPASAQGVGLSSVVKINGIQRLSPSNSTAELLLIGQAGTTINNGVVTDTVVGANWNLPPHVVIPLSGDITVTGTAATAGAIAASPGTIINIATPVPGWQSVTNLQAATAGLPVESDATLRKRQAVSTALPAITPRESILAAVANVRGVGRIQVYDNDSDFYDVNLIPPHSIAVVVEGGDAQTIAETIAFKKNTGCGTYGTTQIVVTDAEGVPNTINFFYLIEMPIFVSISIQPLTGYTDTTGMLIIDAVATYLEGLDIGEDVYAPWLYAPADLAGDAATLSSGMNQAQLDRLSLTYVVRGIWIGLATNPADNADILIPFNAAASCNPSNIIINLMH
jgi:uncharacterized phage protein gp47/JayE